MSGQQTIINVEDEVKLPAFQHFDCVRLPWEKFKSNLKARSRIAAAKTRQQNGTYVVRSGNAKNAPFKTRIEGSGQHEFFHHRQHPVQFPQNFAPTQSELETTRCAHKQVVSKHDSGALQGAADGRLAEQQTRGCRGYTFLLGNRRESDEEVQIHLPEFL